MIALIKNLTKRLLKQRQNTLHIQNDILKIQKQFGNKSDIILIKNVANTSEQIVDVSKIINKDPTFEAKIRDWKYHNKQKRKYKWA